MSDSYPDAGFMAEISTRMQVPDRIVVANHPASPNGAAAAANGNKPADQHKVNDLGMRQRDPRLDMMVPDRILVGGGDTHVASRSTPRELQLEAAVLPPTDEHIRVSTPPRSIRMSEHSFPTATDDEDTVSNSTSTPTFDGGGDARKIREKVYGQRPSAATPDLVESEHRGGESGGGSLALLSDGAGGGGGGVSRDNLAPHEELRLMRRHLAKMNHRLMAVELENQQQQQREMVLTLLVSAYFLGKLVLWINRSL